MQFEKYSTRKEVLSIRLMCCLISIAGDKLTWRLPVHSELEGLNHLSLLQQTTLETLRREIRQLLKRLPINEMNSRV